VWRTRHEAGRAVNRKLVRCKMQREDRAVAYGETVVDRDKLRFISYVDTDSETVTVRKHEKR
jgi:hypothetical protein